MSQKHEPKTTNMKKEFKIFKAGRTNGIETVCSKDGKSFSGKPFVREEKIEFYRSLGYTVTNVDGTAIN